MVGQGFLSLTTTRPSGVRERVFGKGRSRGVADEALEGGAILGFNANAGVEGKSLDEGGTRLAGQSGPGARGAGAQPGRGLFVLRPQELVLVRVVCAVPLLSQKRGDAGADLEGETLELLAGRRRQPKKTKVPIFGLEENAVRGDDVEVRVGV